MNRKVNLTKRIDNGKFCPVVWERADRIHKTKVVTDGKVDPPVTADIAGGVYYIDWSERGKRRRLSVGENAIEAVSAYRRQVHLLANAAHGIQVFGDSPAKSAKIAAPTERTLSSAVTDYLREIEGKDSKTLSAYTVALEYFQASCKKEYLKDVDRDDMLAFATSLRTTKVRRNGKFQPMDDRTVANKFNTVMCFFTWAGKTAFKRQDGRVVPLDRVDVPKRPKKIVETYSDEQLDALFAACNPEERVMFGLLRDTGLRRSEIENAYWSEVDLERRTIEVKFKPGWKPKAATERKVVLSPRLVNALTEYKKQSSGSGRLFKQSGRQMYRRLKKLAEENKIPGRFFLHKFRHTFGSTLNKNKQMDLKTIQELMGHANLSSTERYLKGMDVTQQHEKFEEIFAGSW